MPIRTMLMMLGLVSMMPCPATVLMPMFATKCCTAAAHAGLADRQRRAWAPWPRASCWPRAEPCGTGSVIAAATAALGLGLVGLSLAHAALAAHGACWLLTGFAMMPQMAASNTVLQTIVEENKRGRVMSILFAWRSWAWRLSGVCWPESRRPHRGAVHGGDRRRLLYRRSSLRSQQAAEIRVIYARFIPASESCR